MKLWRVERSALRAACAFGLALTLVACASPAQRTSSPGELRWAGRLALTVQNDPPTSLSAGFDLSGSPAAGELVLSSPLGNQLALVRWSASGAELNQGATTSRHTSLDLLTAELTGETLPVAAVFDWLQGKATSANGWNADLSRLSEGRVTARRLQPLPVAELRLIVQP